MKKEESVRVEDTCEQLCARPLSNRLFIIAFILIRTPHHAILLSGVEKHCFSSFIFFFFDHTVSCINPPLQVLKHLQQGIPLFLPQASWDYCVSSCCPNFFFFFIQKRCVWLIIKNTTISSLRKENVCLFPVRDRKTLMTTNLPFFCATFVIEVKQKTKQTWRFFFWMASC